jgi:biopolymer transport protein ExbD
MMDMFTILLIYLLYFFDPSNDPLKAVELPGSESKAGEIQGVVVTVGLEQIWLGDSELPMERLGEALVLERNRNPELPPERPERLVLKCDRRVAYRRVEEILTVASQAGYKEYRFVVLNEGAQPLNR